jgi:hypothetical protein
LAKGGRAAIRGISGGAELAQGLGKAEGGLAKTLGKVDDVAAKTAGGLAGNALELAAQRRLIEMTGNTPAAHYLAKHSPIVSDEALIQRATKGIDPWTGGLQLSKKGGVVLNDATRFNSYQDMLESIEKAQRAFGAAFPSGAGIPGNGVRLTMDMMRDVGSGFAKVTGEFKSGLNKVVVQFDSMGRVVSAFPAYRN